MDLILDPDTLKDIESYLKRPAHALLIEGSAGSGKGSVVSYISSQLLGIDESKLVHDASFLRVEPDPSTISIATVRTIQDFTKLKTIGSGAVRRIAVIENAQQMTVEAQNAVLKLLEEPPEDTVIILTAPRNLTLLPTIYSRLQKIQLKVPSSQAIQTYYEGQGFSKAEVQKAFNMSNGVPGLMHALLHDDHEHPLTSGIVSAKQLLSQTLHQRMIAVDRLSKDKEVLPQLLQACERIYHALLLQAVEKNQLAQVKRLHKALERTIWTQQQLSHNPNTKLLLTDLLLNL